MNTRTAIFLATMLAIAASFLSSPSGNADTSQFRPPSTPLVTVDPYLSIWSPADRLTDAPTQHWTHRDHPLVSLIRIDGHAYRLMGTDPASVSALPQTGLLVTPTRSIYDFDNGRVHVTLTFMTPFLPDDLAVYARPLTYLTWTVRSVDGASHTVSIYDSASALLTVNEPDTAITWSRQSIAHMTALRAGAENQTLFYPAGDSTRINWGYAYLAAPSQDASAAIGGDGELLSSFLSSGSLPSSDDTRKPRAASDDQPVLAFDFTLGDISSKPVSRHAIIAYDELYAVNWFHHALRPYWRKSGQSFEAMLESAERDYPTLVDRCKKFDDALSADATKIGGAKYAQITALAYRQALAACGLVADENGQPMLLTKESTSNGDIATVDVIYPMDPVLILFSPTLAKATVAPILAYAASPHWKFPNAPHDLGTYPVAYGRDDGGEAMPVEESGNMLLLCDAIVQSDGDISFVTPYWSQLSQWAQFLEQYGLDPGDQLCTDDFMGHLAHNSNLSIKAILALAAYGDLCHRRADDGNAVRYADLAKSNALHWIQVNCTGSYSSLAFDQPGTWSQKYNLVWDKILGLGVFPSDVAAKEIAQYKAALQPFGVPLDSRTKVTKVDWSFWSATLADSQSDFETLTSPIYDYLNQTTARDPLTDSYFTDNVHSNGFHARPVVGGIFIKMLADRAIWHKWASADTAKVANWAPIPKPQSVTEVVPSSQHAAQIWRYSTKDPGPNWMNPDFDDSSWAQGPAGFGSKGTPNAIVGTPWTDTPGDIYIRRIVTIPPGTYHDLQFWNYHDDDIDVYVNGVLAAREAGWTTNYSTLAPYSAAAKLLEPGAKLLLAVHCHQNAGGQDIDLGLCDVQP